MIVVKKKIGTGFYLVPVDSDGFEEMAKMQLEKFYNAKITQKRNVKRHRLYFALIKAGFENQDEYVSIEHYRKALQLAIGSVDVIRKINGDVVQIPKSISFDSMDEVEFRQTVFEPTAQVIAEHLGIDDVDQLKEMLSLYS